jgi:hypothetical protein
MRKILAGCVALVAVSWLTAGCSSSGSNGGSGGSSASSGGSTGSGSGGTGSGGSSSSGSDASGNGNCILPTTWVENAQNAMCISCMQENCCSVIVACASDPGCLAIYNCENKCYEGMGPDGGVVAGDDAGTDDAGNTAMDNCVMDCQKAGSAAALALYNPQNNCVNDMVPPNCGMTQICF